MSQKNTLFKYFTPSPTAPKTPKNDAKNAMSLSRSKSESKSEFKKTLCDKSPNDRLNSAAKSKKSEKSAKKQLITSGKSVHCILKLIRKVGFMLHPNLGFRRRKQGSIE